MKKLFSDGLVRWVDPALLQSRPGTLHIQPGSDYWLDAAWQSEQFKAQALPVYQGLLDWVKTQHWWMYEPKEGERQMFSVWFAHAIGARHYDNPLIHDLYLLHDLLHAHTFIDAPADTTERWIARMRANEIMVSLETEVLIYARCPGLRPHSFDRVLWSDGLLAAAGAVGGPGDYGVEVNDEEELLLTAASLWPLTIPAGWSGLWWARRAASVRPRKGCPHEAAIASYEGKAMADYRDWGEEWREVERYRLEQLVS